MLRRLDERGQRASSTRRCARSASSGRRCTAATSSGRPSSLPASSPLAACRCRSCRSRRWGIGKATTAIDLAELHRAIWLASAGLGPLGTPEPGISAGRGALPDLRARARRRPREARPVRSHGPGVRCSTRRAGSNAARHDAGLVVWRGGIFVAAVMTYRASRRRDAVGRARGQGHDRRAAPLPRLDALPRRREGARPKRGALAGSRRAPSECAAGPSVSTPGGEIGIANLPRLHWSGRLRRVCERSVRVQSGSTRTDAH